MEKHKLPLFFLCRFSNSETKLNITIMLDFMLHCLNVLCIGRQFESSTGMADPASDNEKYYIEVITLNAFGFCLKNEDHKYCQNRV